MARSTVRLLLIVAASLVTTVALAAQRTYERQLSAPPGGRLTLHTDIGSVAVIGSDAAEVIIHAEMHGTSSFLAGFHIRAEQTPSGVTISAHERHHSFLHWFDFNSNGVRFTIQVPRGYPVHVRTSGGNLDVRDLNAPVRASTSGGSVEAENIQGAATLSTSGGGIDVRDSTGDLDLHTGGGSIRMRNDDGQVRAYTSGGDIRAQLRSNRGIALRTSGGDITLLLPQGTQASIDAGTSGGHVTCDFPLTVAHFTSASHLRGSIGAGGARISLHTSGGDIRIAPEK